MTNTLVKLLFIASFTSVLVSIGYSTDTKAATEVVATSAETQNYVLYIPFQDYPRSASNFPRATTRTCGSDFRTYKSSPVVFSSSGLSDGNTFDENGSCRAPSRDGGTNTTMVDPATGFTGGAGAWIYPSAYGNWTKDTSTTTSGWYRVDNRPPKSPLRCTDTTSTKLDVASLNAYPQIWGSRCRDDKDKSWYFELETPRCSFNNGTTLYRNIFTLTQEQIDTINMAGASMTLGLVADDWSAVYINGYFVNAETETATVYYDANILKSYLNVGTNVLAIQVSDKGVERTSDCSPESRGSGVKYALRIVTPDGYNLDPKSQCFDSAGNIITAPVAAGSVVTCRHSFPMKAGSFDNITLPTKYTVSCVQNLGATTSAPCSVPETPSGGWSVPGTQYTRASLAPPNYIQEITFTINGPAGSNICTSIRVNPGGKNNYGGYGGWGGGGGTGPLTSTPACVYIGSGGGAAAAPLAYFLSGDVFANGNIRGATYTLGGITYGSHGDYTVIGNQQITDMGSKAGATSSALTFAAPAPLGGMIRIPLGPPSLNMSGAAFTNSGVTLTSFTSGTYSKSGNVDIVNSTNINQNLTLYIDGDLNINGNITVDDSSLFAAAQLPNIVIVASGNITINEGVDRVDATLISHGTLKTCDAPKTSLSASVCNQKLVINGPVIAKNIALYRTNTSPSSEHLGAAETIIYRPSALIVPYLQPTSGALTTEIERELPPRF